MCLIEKIWLVFVLQRCGWLPPFWSWNASNAVTYRSCSSWKASSAANESSCGSRKTLHTAFVQRILVLQRSSPATNFLGKEKAFGMVDTEFFSCYLLIDVIIRNVCGHLHYLRTPTLNPKPA